MAIEDAEIDGAARPAAGAEHVEPRGAGEQRGPARPGRQVLAVLRGHADHLSLSVALIYSQAGQNCGDRGASVFKMRLSRTAAEAPGPVAAPRPHEARRAGRGGRCQRDGDGRPGGVGRDLGAPRRRRRLARQLRRPEGRKPGERPPAPRPNNGRLFDRTFGERPRGSKIVRA
jgi:hypothetical protein